MIHKKKRHTQRRASWRFKVHSTIYWHAKLTRKKFDSHQSVTDPAGAKTRLWSMTALHGLWRIYASWAFTIITAFRAQLGLVMSLLVIFSYALTKLCIQNKTALSYDHEQFICSLNCWIWNVHMHTCTRHAADRNTHAVVLVIVLLEWWRHNF